MSDFNDFDDIHYPRPEASDFSKIIDRAVSRRSFLKTSAAFGVGAFVTGTGSIAFAADSTAAAPASKLLGFTAIAANSDDTITVPEGYKWQVLASWGQPMFSDGAEFDHKTRGTAESQMRSFGDNTDGMKLFQTSETTGVIAINNEYTNRDIISPNGIETAEEVAKGKAAHGISIFNVELDKGEWKMVVDGDKNRRITADSAMEITGPARGHDLLKTSADKEGVASLGTWNNCGNGSTPWGTYLTCEENFNGYFASQDENAAPTAEQKRYGVGTKDWGYNWYKFDDRFDIAKEPNECNRAGYIVEIDPMNPESTPKKRTALGRFKHENAELVVAKNGKVVVYLGDDERGEFLYRFVSAGSFKEGDDAANAELLNEGTLYVAQFGEADKDLSGRGKWLELSVGKNGISADNGFPTQAEICIHTRIAGSIAGATTMDRPEWVAANPTKVEAYCALTNNKNRGKKPNKGGDDTPVGGPNPRAGNLYGQIVRWVPDNEDHTAEEFAWDLFVMAGNPTVHAGTPEAGSANVTAENMFNSPDGIAFDGDGRLWIQTDGNYSNKENFAGMGNNQMLCGDPETGEIRRFLVGPISCEITGFAWTDDFKTVFVGVQHPGEKGKPSHFPGGGDTTPRSSVIAITREDGGVIGA